MLISARKLLSLLLLCLSLTACGGGDQAGESVVCTLPCLAASPTVDVTSISSATGGTVKLSFKIAGNISDVSVVTVMLFPNTLAPGLPAGNGVIMNPSTVENSVDINVDAGTTTGRYYPHISFTVVTPSNSGIQYYLDPTKSGSQYTYTEVVSGSASSPTLSGLNVPLVNVKP